MSTSDGDAGEEGMDEEWTDGPERPTLGSLAEAEQLDGETANTEETGDGRVRETQWQAITDAAAVVRIESGDKIIFEDGRVRDVLDVGDDISDTNGLHVRASHPDEESTVIHLRLIHRWLAEERIVVVGLRTREYADPDNV